MNIFDQFTNFWKLFCKPSRQQYSNFDLGSPIFYNDSCQYKRTDFTLKNVRKQEIRCSLYEPFNKVYDSCIVYLHSLNGSRMESAKYVQFAIERGFSFFSFDFPGCGLSEGEYVSLGYYEQNDVDIVINYLKMKKNTIYWFMGQINGCCNCIIIFIKVNIYYIYIYLYFQILKQCQCFSFRQSIFKYQKCRC
ncbi:hypothetical protein IMG5_141100 [Ichthyophthirius multifiliis]|uniref:Serine aminopeptidase S33 domain-containing protein n=1 Tax=Ichthyophthirius multifiliis TaxID=5932 RepID=G0QXC6_ICHMU|nr:hypothetical protein IMG5_141100 [Ichthyophthirius multifiliis]EGR30129.1 hypothetical protein IMG5_141100 [Ichthyophthirius multifiliis]|eukprot:XP_004031365.1 hypothetical protein IMG5_141100 [Ichthyophthirius multifiliis]